MSDAVIPFTKMHGLENDYLFLDAVAVPGLVEGVDLAAMARAMSDRHKGVGADGVIVVSRARGRNGGSSGAGVEMRIFNSDGSDGGMCGNGARCVVKLAVERGYVKGDERGRVGLVVAERELVAWAEVGDGGKVDRVTLDMGEPVLELEKIPVDPRHLGSRTDPLHRHEHFVDGYEAVFVNVGNPHAVLFTQRDAEALVNEIGPGLERHQAFPQRINVQVVNVTSAKRVELRTWERGAGRTRACGTGACAVGVAGVLTDRTERRVTVGMLGGDLEIEWDAKTNHVLMTGPAVEVFSGEWSLGSGS